MLITRFGPGHRISCRLLRTFRACRSIGVSVREDAVNARSDFVVVDCLLVVSEDVYANDLCVCREQSETQTDRSIGRNLMWC